LIKVMDTMDRGSSQFNPGKATSEGGPATIKPWLSRLLRNEVVNYDRQHQNPTVSDLMLSREGDEEPREGLEELLIKPVPGVETTWLTRERKKALSGCKDRLPEIEGEVIHLVFWERLKQKEIAAALELDPVKVTRIKQDALEHLLDCLKRKNAL
jgi:RNA polymerase sigma factor (sigma-70 family)